jgi:hypothetical protein
VTDTSSIATSADRGQRPARARTQRAVFAIAASGAALATLDQFVVNVAFPAISRGLHGDVSAVSWVLNGYSIVFAALLVPAGRLADRNGLKRGFVLGVAVFTIASLACAASGTLSFNLWVQGGWGWSPLHFGLAFVPGPLILPAMMPAIGRIVRVVGWGVTAALGCLLLAASASAGFALISRVPDYAGAMLPGVLLAGFGVALALPALTGAGTEPLPPQRFATGSGILNMSRQLGFTAGVGIAAAVLGSAAAGLASLPDFQRAWLVTGLLALTAAAVAGWLALAARRTGSGKQPAGSRGPTGDAPSKSNEEAPAARTG